MSQSSSGFQTAKNGVDSLPMIALKSKHGSMANLQQPILM